MNARPLTLEDREWASSQELARSPAFSESSFANLYLFRRMHQYEVVEIEGLRWIRGVTRDRVPHLIPHPSRPLLSQQQLRHLLMCSETHCLYPVERAEAESFESIGCTITYDRGDSDYVYPVSNFLSYRGNQLSSRKNLVAQFLKNPNITVLPLHATTKSDAEEVLNKWLDAKAADAQQEADACREALHLLGALALTGWVVYAASRPAGFAIGEFCSNQGLFLHFAKSLPSLKGSTPYLYQIAARAVHATGGTWMNLAQDLGLPGLRQAKLAYCPSQILHKWRVAPRRSAQTLPST